MQRKNISLSYTKKALEIIAEKSYGKPYGARDIRRVIRQEVEDSIAQLIIEKSSEISEIHISAEGDSLKVTARKGQTE